MSPTFSYSDLLPLGEDTTQYRLISEDGVSVVKLGDKEFLQVTPEALTLLTETAIHDISHYLRAEHLGQLAKILKDPEASANDRFVALDLLKNANIAAGGILPMCQDTGTALIMGKKGQYLLQHGKRRTPEITCLHRLRSMQIATTKASTTLCLSLRVAEAPTNRSCIKRQRQC